jgi:hypothetical protein
VKTADIKMPRSTERLSASASSLPNRSWEAFIINIAGSESILPDLIFGTHTHVKRLFE